ncbi:carbohydrate ABC transporter permease [Paenibacillus oryzisoli]|uniref:carbohydrate ABC transporter permease n=1 Tax=Paenibacillus oryzisoli TaxID=1850517 RepID=UPI003D26B2B5
MAEKWTSRWFDMMNVLLLSIFALLCLIPFFHVFAMSTANVKDQMSGDFILWPKTWDFTSYIYIFDTGVFFQSLSNSIFVTVMGTAVNMILTTLTAFVLSRRNFSGRRWIMLMIIFTMMFGGGLIPTYLVVKATGLINSLWALIIPSAISAFNVIIIREFFESIDEGIIESAVIDGCSDWGIFWRIVLPLSTASLATFTLFYAVGNWNQYFSAVIYINKPTLWPLQVLLRQVVSVGQSDLFNLNDSDRPLPPAISIQMATVILTALPIVALYPFLQRYFVKGVTLGAVKG